MRSTRKWTALMTGLTLALALAFPAASRADTVALGPYGSVTWTLNAAGTVASFVFSANSGYMLIDSNVADLNVNASSWTIGNFAVTQDTADGFQAQPVGYPQSSGSGNVGNQVGQMNQTVTAFDGFGYGMTSISFDITNTASTWANTAAVLIANALGNILGAHFAICNGTCDPANMTTWTGFIGNTPLPPAALLFGTALVGLGILGRRRKKEFPAA